MIIMDKDLINNQNNVDLYLTDTHNCNYLLGSTAQAVFVGSSKTIDQFLYQNLLASGFRRSGNFVYRPHCQNCTACVPIRLPVQQFIPRRAQRRCWQRVIDDLHVICLKPAFYVRQYKLYQRYIDARHDDGSMSNPTPDDYLHFLTTHCCPSMFVEFRYQKQLIAVAVTDVLPNALSAVYTFFDPDFSHYSPGVLAILWQIQEAKQRNLPYLYLGYWIENCQKMRYKNQYRPLEAWDGKNWKFYGPNEPIELLPCIS